MTMRKSIALVSILAILLTIIPPLPGRGQQARQPTAGISVPTPSPTPVGQPTPFPTPTPAPTPDIDQTPTDNISLEGDLGLRQDTDPVIAAQAALVAQGAIFGRGPDDFENTDYEQPDELGTDHIRMTQTYKGVHVLGGELIVHMTSDRVTGINGRFVQNLQLSTLPVLGVDEAESSAAADVELRGGQEILVPSRATRCATCSIPAPIVTRGPESTPETGTRITGTPTLITEAFTTIAGLPTSSTSS
jgi:hypothetical protein